MTQTSARPRLRAAAAALPLLLLAACAGTADPAAPGTTASADTEATPAGAAESATYRPRLVVSYDGGLLVLDADTLETVGTVERDGFLRVNPAGDGRHVLVSTDAGFEVLDAGTWAEEHGDHAHYWTADPALTDVTYAAEKPGHAVVHEDRVALFDDGTGTVTVLDVHDVAAGDEAVTRTYTTPSAHHGVAVLRSDDALVVSDGTEEARTGVRLLDADDTEIAATADCPGVHGEAVAADEVVVVGCEDGVVVVGPDAVTKVASPDAYGRIGNQAGSEESPVVLGDYKSDPDAEHEHPTRVSLVDTRTASLRLVDLPASYTFRSLGRGREGEALVLGTDGALHVIDPEAGALVRSVPLIDAWTEPEEWQEPRPTLHVLDRTAYVTDPATNRVLAVDVATGEVWRSVELDVTPNELTSAAGRHTH